MDIKEIEGIIEGILFASGEPVKIDRIAAVLSVEPQSVKDIAERLAESYINERRGIRLVRLDNALQLCSAPEYSDSIRTVLETRKPPQLSQTSLEVLSIVAYFQPVTRAYIEQVRGVDSSYTVSLLTERGLIESAGHLDAPGRPTLFKTTDNFLRTFGISSLDELPELPDVAADDEQLGISEAIRAINSAGAEGNEETDEDIG